MNEVLTINPEYQKFLPKLPIEEYEALKESIRTEGQHYLIVTNKEGIILDGHHRFQICQELSLTPKYEIKEFPSSLYEKKFVIESNLKRRHLNKFQRAKLMLPLLEIEKELAKQRQEHNATEGNISLSSQPKKVRKPLTEEQKGKRRLRQKAKTEEKKKAGIVRKKEKRARSVVAKQVQISDRTLEKAKEILEKGSEELKQKVENGDTSISYAYKIVKRNERKINQPPLPEGEYNVIYADPPWIYDLDLRGDPAEHYPVMEQEQICNLKLPIAENAILFLWATNPKLQEALEVLKAWGFTYKTNLVWVKDKFGTGYYFRGQHELLLVGAKGNISVPEEANRPTSVLTAPRTNHSKKPTEVYPIIEKMYPNHKCLELFGRGQPRDGWTVWGNEVEKS